MHLYLEGWILLGSRIVQYLLEDFEDRGLKHHGRQFTIPSDAMKHFGNAVIRQRRVGCILTQHEAVGVDDLVMSKPVHISNRIH